jgi:DNA helicase HerA-like ATPase
MADATLTLSPGEARTDAPARSRSAIGRVVSVDGSRAVITSEPGGPEVAGNPVSIGKLITIGAGPSRVIALVYATTLAGSGGGQHIVINVELVGEISLPSSGASPRFDRGIAEYPAIGAVAYTIETSDLEIIYASGSGADTITIGRLVQDRSIEPTLRVRDLVAKHFAVLGTTGCGKSSAISHLLHQILEADATTRVVIVDPHNEYKSAFGRHALVVSPANLNLPYWLFSFEEIVDVIYRRRPGVDEELDALADLIPLAKARFSQKPERTSSLLRKDREGDGGHTVDSPVPYRMSDVLTVIEEQLGKLDGKLDRPKLRRLKSRIESVMQDPRYQFMFPSRNVEDAMPEILSTLFRIPPDGRRVTILELAGFPAEVVDAVVSVICRLAFDLGVWSGGAVPILVVCEEAHRYVPNDKRLGFGPTRRALSRIAKEGRKYGISLGIVSQRPAELDPTILSQCSTVMAMRLANDADHAIIRSAVSDAAASILAFLPTMGNREAIAFGEAVAIPMRIRFAQLQSSELPQGYSRPSENSFEEQSAEFLDEIVGRWRRVASNGA